MGIIVVLELLTRFHNVASIVQPSTKKLVSSPRHVIDAKEMVEFHEARDPSKSLILIELFDVWGIYFMGPFVSSH